LFEIVLVDRIGTIYIYRRALDFLRLKYLPISQIHHERFGMTPTRTKI